MYIDLYLNNIAASTMNVVLKRPPAIVSAPERGEWIEVAGLDGEYWQSDHALANVSIDVELYAYETADPAAVIMWIRSATALRWGNNAWEYHIDPRDTQIDLPPWGELYECGWEFKITLKVQPYRYRYPAETMIYMTSNPYTLVNPGTADSEPLISISSPGEETLQIGGFTVLIADHAERMIINIDCAEKRAYNNNRTVLLTGMITLVETADGRWPKLKPGNNLIQWSGDGRLVWITPRWRDR